MNDAKLVTLEQLRGFLAGAADLSLTPTAEPAARYGFIKKVLKEPVRSFVCEAYHVV